MSHSKETNRPKSEHWDALPDHKADHKTRASAQPTLGNLLGGLTETRYNMEKTLNGIVHQLGMLGFSRPLSLDQQDMASHKDGGGQGPAMEMLFEQGRALNALADTLRAVLDSLAEQYNH